jgi:spermidine synthase
MKPWKVLGTVDTDEGKLQLRQREQEFLIVIDGRVLMTSTERKSEQGLATLACAPFAKLPAPRVLIGGLGMAYTLRAALDALPAGAQVTVAELNPTVESWCRSHLAPLTANSVGDPRVKVVIDDVARVIATAPRGHYHAIMLDLYEGPHAATQEPDDPFYGKGALQRSKDALAPDGILSIWSEEPDGKFASRFASAGFDVTTHRMGSSRAHIVYLGKRRS